MKTFLTGVLIVIVLIGIFVVLERISPSFKEEMCYKYYQMGWMLDKDRTSKMWDRARWRRQRKEFARPVVAVDGKILFFSKRYPKNSKVAIPGIYVLSKGVYSFVVQGGKPRFSSDGKKIIRLLLGKFEILNLKGEVLQTIVYPSHFSVIYSFDWSPDEKKICFVADSEENPVENLFIFDLTTKEVTQITHFNNQYRNPEITYPRWSPDGKKILFGGCIDPGEGIPGVSGHLF